MEFDADLETAAANAGETLDEDVATVFVTAWEPEVLGDDDGYVYSYSYGAWPSGGSSSDDDANAAIIGGSVAAVAVVLLALGAGVAYKLHADGRPAARRGRAETAKDVELSDIFKPSVCNGGLDAPDGFRPSAAADMVRPAAEASPPEDAEAPPPEDAAEPEPRRTSWFGRRSSAGTPSPANGGIDGGIA